MLQMPAACGPAPGAEKPLALTNGYGQRKLPDLHANVAKRVADFNTPATDRQSTGAQQIRTRAPKRTRGVE